jgi:hypothetical protein
MGLNIGGGASSGNTQAVVTPEQTRQNQLTNQLLETLVPTYQGAVSGAGQALEMSKQGILNASQQGLNTSLATANNLNAGGLGALYNAKSSLENVISPDYIKNQLAAATQPIQEQTRELQNQQNAQYGGAGNLGSARGALADANLASLNQQRQNQAVAGAIANITGQQIGAASGLGQMGAQAVQGAQGANQAALGFAGAPQTAYQQYAQTVFGVPGGASQGNFGGTQGQTTSSKGFGGSGKVASP